MEYEYLKNAHIYKAAEAIVFGAAANGFDFGNRDPKELMESYRVWSIYSSDNKLSLQAFKDCNGETIMYDFKIKNGKISVEKYVGFPGDNMKEEIENAKKYLKEKIESETNPERKFELQGMLDELNYLKIKKRSIKNDKELDEILSLAEDYLKYSA